MSPTPSVPRGGPCQPWVLGSAVEALPNVQDVAAAVMAKGHLTHDQLVELCGQVAEAASGGLYEMSGSIYTGADCGPVTVRPVSRPVDMDTRIRPGLGVTGWNGSGTGTGWGGAPGVLPHYGRSNPPEIDLLVHPVTEIVQVKIDGDIIPEAEYELRDHRRLVRLRTSASAVPTARFGWPTSQIPDIPDTEPGTFSVTFKYGQPPPALGEVAALKLAELLLLPILGDSKRYPQRVTSSSRQGVSVATVDVMDVLKAKQTGIYEVDLFLLTYNPGRNRRQGRVFSPDKSKGRRTAVSD